MAENKAAGEKPAAKRKASEPVSIPAFVYVVTIVLALGGAGYWFLQREAAPPRKPVLTPEAKSYVRNLQLSGVSMKATETIAKQLLVEIEGQIGNNGDRVLNRVEINCIFYDPYGLVVLRERVPIVGRRTGPLAPGEIKNFRLAFDTLPESWNQGMPQLVIAEIIFG